MLSCSGSKGVSHCDAVLVDGGGCFKMFLDTITQCPA